MLPGRELINEIEQSLSDLDTDQWELSAKLEDYILGNEDYFLGEWREIKRDYPEKSARNQLSLMLDLIQSEAYSERKKLKASIDILAEIDDELENLIEFDEEDFAPKPTQLPLKTDLSFAKTNKWQICRDTSASAQR
jgi:hypothetical protein